MICNPCKVEVHKECRGGTWCNCQHKSRDAGLVKPAPQVLSVEGIESQEAHGEM